jgi:glutamate/tyrosine decarboxylase-like PLP-dependent enzyme
LNLLVIYCLAANLGGDPILKDDIMASFSKSGMSREDVFSRLEAFRQNDIKWQDGRVFGYIFDPGQAVQEIAKQAYTMFLSENGLDFSVFQSLLILEKELAAIGRRHLRGDADVVGNFTSGGTESILLAVKAARDYYRSIRPEITAPEMILPTTAHAAFHKAGHYLDVNVVRVAVDPATFRADPAAIEAAITPNTILLVGSAPSYSHGVVDPITDLGRIALDHEVWLHADACMGGFLLPYFRRLGAPVPDFDFKVPGVSSISMDLHKYAYTPKGASLVLYRHKDLRKHQLFACSHWIGYTIVNNAVQSSKSGGPMAAAWAVLNTIGDDGYLEIARKKLEATQKIADGIAALDGLRLLTRPDMCLVSFTTTQGSVFHLVDEMNARGWYIQPALSFENSPAHVHLSINASNVGREAALLADLKECVAKIGTMPTGDLVQLVQSGLDGIDLAALSEKELTDMLALAGIGDEGLPQRMAEINGVLDALPPNVREQLLVTFVNNLFS